MKESGSRLSRRRFVKFLIATGLGVPLVSCRGEEFPPSYPSPEVFPGTPGALRPKEVVASPASRPSSEAFPETPGAVQPEAVVSPLGGGQVYLAVARGQDPRAITRAAVAALGGVERFVRAGMDVIIKPNICVDYHSYEYAATTNPEVVAALVELCLGAGAKRVRVMDSPFAGSAESAYARSSIADAVAAAGGVMEVMNQAKFRQTEIPDGRDITRWPIYQDVLTADLVINVPIAKHHSLARLTLGGKNLLGVILNRNKIHANLGQRIADLVSAIRPTLTVVDAVRMLMANGPTGGRLDDVRVMNTVIASHDIVAADAYAATLFGLTGEQISYVKAAAEMNLGTLDLSAIRIEEIAVS